jgi:hypothetical protein
MATATSDQGPAPPPNLRTAPDEDKECGNCVYYDNVHCTRFPPLCVDDEWLCDAWKAGGKDTEPGEPTGAKTVRDAGKETLARLHRPG